MSDDSPKKFDRIIAILIQLQSKKIVKAQELADRFQVSLRTIYRDIRTLEQAGVPLYGEAGLGYSLVEGYRLPPVMFTRAEATSFIAAEKLMQKFTDEQLRRDYDSALFKLKAVLNAEEKERVEQLAHRVFVRPGRLSEPSKAPNALAEILKNIARKTKVELLYEAVNAAPVSRLIEPVGIFHDNHHWYILGFCYLRNDYRQFRTDRIHNITGTDRPFKRVHEPLETYLDKPSDADSIKIRVEKAVIPYIIQDAYSYGLVNQTASEDGVEMEFMCRDTEHGFARWFLMFSDHAEIVSPEALKNRVRELLKTALARFT